ncbi:GNAT family N-acetyltransferase [Bradyrhizobium sp. NP1]|uniref:GNAT family N-acetyltransferase n=1 Tax=Bradyrhizobium sp. NP1 TaxID=3049772 RepID=UPI0025A5E7AA|nr:GNAT family N-acetyltransferase [Bradyrhizobium sp. NP1]WJR78423.1 GNAT family N-acetyltransferase [Bradyrhizobium sp. NP1]
MPPAYRVRPMTQIDLPAIRDWLATPHVREWWGDPDEQYVLVSGDLEEPAMDQYIVSLGNDAFGYLQCYALTAWNTGFGEQPAGTRGIDLFIGDPSMIGRGHGSVLIRAFTDARLEDGVPRIVTDPDPANKRAIRAYEKAGFVADRTVDTPDGVALLMVRNP